MKKKYDLSIIDSFAPVNLIKKYRIALIMAIAITIYNKLMFISPPPLAKLLTIGLCLIDNFQLIELR